MNGTLRSLALVTLVALGAFAGTAVAASSPSLTASPSTPGETSTHTATLTVGDDATGSLNGFTVDYSNAGMNVSNVGTEDVVKVGIDRGDDASGDAVDVDVSDDLSKVQTSNNGKTLTLKFGGSYSLNSSDEVVVVVDNVENPSAGDYKVNLDINPQSSGGAADATMTIEESSSNEDTTTATDESTTDSSTETTDEDAASSDDTETEESTQEDSSEETTEASSDSSEESGDSSGEETSTDAPGFGVALTLVALLGAAFVAVRRRD